MKKQPPKGHATGQFTQYADLAGQRGYRWHLLIAGDDMLHPSSPDSLKQWHSAPSEPLLLAGTMKSLRQTATDARHQLSREVRCSSTAIGPWRA